MAFCCAARDDTPRADRRVRSGISCRATRRWRRTSPPLPRGVFPPGHWNLRDDALRIVDHWSAMDAAPRSDRSIDRDDRGDSSRSAASSRGTSSGDRSAHAGDDRRLRPLRHRRAACGDRLHRRLGTESKDVRRARRHQLEFSAECLVSLGPSRLSAAAAADVRLDHSFQR